MTVLLTEERGSVFYFEVDELWEEDEKEWTTFLESKDFDVKSVKKTLFEGRGCLKVELENKELYERMLNATEAETPHDKEPIEDKIYKVKASKKVLVRPQTNIYSRDPFYVDEGTKIQINGSMSGQGRRWGATIVNGDNEGVKIVITDQEWHRYGMWLKPLGKKIDGTVVDNEQNDQSSDGLTVNDEESEEELDKEKSDNPFARSGAYNRVNQDFPAFPDRTPIEDYFNMELPDEPMGGEGGGGGGGFGGGF